MEEKRKDKSLLFIYKVASYKFGWREFTFEIEIINAKLSLLFNKISYLIFSLREGNLEYSNYCTIALISRTSKVMLKILQARLQQYMNHELPDVQAGFRKDRGTRDQIANIHGSLKKQQSSRKTSTSALLTMPKPLCGPQQTGKFLKRWPPYLTLEKSVCRSGLDTEQQTGSKSGKGYVKAIYRHPTYLTYMQSTS